MDRNTITTISELAIGDRYVNPRHPSDVWQVISKGPKYVTVNRFDEQGKRVLKYDQLKKGTDTVRFLRHTSPPHPQTAA
jgi:hypothetical protein